MKNLTPLKAIRKFCLNCYGNDEHAASEVKTCVPPCEFFDYRFDKILNKKNRKLCKIIRSKCRWCMNGNINDIKNCLTSKCIIYPFRMGKNPNYKSIKSVVGDGF